MKSVDMRLPQARIEEMAKDGLCGVEEAAQFVGISGGEIRRLIQKCEIRAVEYGRRILIPRTELREFVVRTIRASEPLAVKKGGSNGK